MVYLVRTQLLQYLMIINKDMISLETFRKEIAIVNYLVFSLMKMMRTKKIGNSSLRERLIRSYTSKLNHR